jgi:hypothetical protein
MHIKTHDPLQKGYQYELAAPQGREFSIEFTPDLTPAEMLALGVFEGNYFDGWHEDYPADWFVHLKKVNYFKVSASQSLQVWQAKGWIHPIDPRGWFQWYCRYYLGRRVPQEDARQIKRWKAMQRHSAQIKMNCQVGDATCRPKQRQALLHWAYDSRRI